jgi:hypothetical protein
MLLLYFRKEHSTAPANRAPRNELPVITVQPASHHRPSFVDSVTKPIHTSVKSFQHHRHSNQPSSRMMPTVGSLNSVCPVTTTESNTQGSLSNPVVGVPQQEILQQTGRLPSLSVKAAATMPPLHVAEADADYMLRFRSFLLYFMIMEVCFHFDCYLYAIKGSAQSAVIIRFQTNAC